MNGLYKYDNYWAVRFCICNPYLLFKNSLLDFSVECTDCTSAGRAAPWRQAEGHDDLYHRRSRQGCGGKAHFSEGKLFVGISSLKGFGKSGASDPVHPKD